MALYCPTIITFLLILLLAPGTSAVGAIRGPKKLRHEAIVSHHGAVASDDVRCSRIGMDILRDGGNAIDSAVASALCLGVVSPASSGLGGGAFMVIRLANGKSQAFDMRETAPLLASKDMYRGNATLKARGALSIAVPGELAGLHEAWKQHGKLPWEKLVRPAEQFARKGYKISPYLHTQMVTSRQYIFSDEGLRHIFTKNNDLVKAGELVRNLKLAHSLRRIAKYGPKAFYNGSIGLHLVRDVQRLGGILTMKDLQTYQVKMRKPLFTKILGLEVLGMPPPSSGAASMFLILNILSQYGVPSGISGPLGIHRLVEAFKHAFALRMNLGDPDFVDVTKVVSDMISPKFAEELRKSINDSRTYGPSHYGGRWNQVSDHGTSHVSIVDQDRNAVSMTNTINWYFGAKMLSPTTGIVLNNEMDDFSMPSTNASSSAPPPAPPNFIFPRKRPLSSMTPTIVLKDKEVIGVVGGSGGVKIICSTTQTFINYFFKGMDPLSSVMAPRVYHQLIPNTVYYENWTSVTGDHFEVPLKIREALKKRGHVLESLEGGSMCQFIALGETRNGFGGNGELVAVSDPRKGGIPAGY